MTLVMTFAGGPALGSTALGADRVVVVRPGDTLSDIALRHRVAIARLVGLNRLGDPNRIYAGQRLVLGASSRATRHAPARRATKRIHIIGYGQNLTLIARSYGVTVDALVRTNRIADPGRIYAGQRLAIPGAGGGGRRASPPTARTARPSRPASRIHAVSAGQTLTHIALRYGVSVGALAAANHLRDPGRIYAGQRLRIPGAARATRQPRQAPAARPAVPPSMAALMAQRAAVRRVIVEEARRYRVPVALALSVAWQESGWQQGVVSHAGAIGVMQLMPATAEWVAETMLRARVNPRDTRQNVRAGVRLLRHYLDRYDGRRKLVLAAYYQGQAAVDRFGVYTVSWPYIASIRALERLLVR